jgi:hypothetical protein
MRVFHVRYFYAQILNAGCWFSVSLSSVLNGETCELQDVYFIGSFSPPTPFCSTWNNFDNLWYRYIYIYIYIYIHTHTHTHTQRIHKRMVQFRKLTRNVFLTLHGHNLHRQQRQLSKCLVRYQQFASNAYRGASFQDGVAAGKGFLCAPFWGVQICDYSAEWVLCTV